MIDSGPPPKYYWRGIRLPRWLFVLIWGEVTIRSLKDSERP